MLLDVEGILESPSISKFVERHKFVLLGDLFLLFVCVCSTCHLLDPMIAVAGGRSFCLHMYE